uniref:Integrase catalytic domain-containing protein n=1 Tax=Anopheles dirus TaxID=7168 RepID=A0A182N7R2_9DIPT
MSLFDPQGFLAPILVHGRILMQDMWRSCIDWDEEIGELEFRKWKQWVEMLAYVYKLSIPRWYFHGAPSTSLGDIQLHIFTDASEQAYGCVGRFVRNCQRKKNNKPIYTLRATEAQKRLIRRNMVSTIVPIMTEEYEQAEILLFRIAQKDHYLNELKILKRSEEAKKHFIEHTSPIYNADPFLDEDGVIRMNGRTAKATHVPYDTRFPVILPNQHAITTLLLRNYHERYGHANRETVVNEVRQRFYIPFLRSSIDKITKSCQHCKTRKCQPRYPRMANLPEQRLTPFVHPFGNVGIDYLGPIDVINARRVEKRYVAVFTCLVTRAVHLEVAHSLSTEACIMAIRRFVCRRGPPVEIFSDNGTNFQGASNELKKQIADIQIDCATTFTDSHTKWNFNPPSAPHMGGVWERMVRSVKEGLQALNDGRKLNDEILTTVLLEVENLINSRPLTYMPQNSSDNVALTPNHFLIGSSAGKKDRMGPLPDPAEVLRNTYKRSTQLAERMWNRWLKKYLPTLNQRTKWIKHSCQLRVGDLVFIAEGPRKAWMRAIVEEVFPASDGTIRQAVVRTAQGKYLKRPVVKLAVLETDLDH